MKKMSNLVRETIINFNTDEIEMLGESHQLVSTKSGHYAIPIKNYNVYNCETISEEEIKELQVLFTLKEGEDVNVVARKLHLQFTHPRTERIVKFMKTAGVENDELLEAMKEAREQCDTCKRFKPKMPRPVVTLPMSSDFNDTVAMDLKIYKNNDIYLTRLQSQ